MEIIGQHFVFLFSMLTMVTFYGILRAEYAVNDDIHMFPRCLNVSLDFSSHPNSSFTWTHNLIRLQVEFFV
jgi:hypothetical protein